MAVEKRTGNVVKVDVAQFLVGRSPMQMMTMALGSCLGIVLYDPGMEPERARVAADSLLSALLLVSPAAAVEGSITL